jgi:hypothetical protein
MTSLTTTKNNGGMTWEYRVMARDDELAIFEVYYGENGEIKGYSIDPVSPGGSTVEELKINCDLYVAALAKPVLAYR